MLCSFVVCVQCALFRKCDVHYLERFHRGDNRMLMDAIWVEFINDIKYYFIVTCACIVCRVHYLEGYLFKIMMSSLDRVN